MQNIKEIRKQQECFLWHWNTRPSQRGRLFMIHNTPQNDIQGSILKGAGMVRGVPDLLYLLANGKYIFIEMKLEKGIQTKFQIWFQIIVTKLNGNYKIVRSLEEFKTLIEGYEEQEKVSGLSFALPEYPFTG